MFGGKDIVMAQLRKRAQRDFSSPRQILSKLYETRTATEVGSVLGVTKKPILEAMRRLRVNRRNRATPAPKGVVAQALARRGRTTNKSPREMFISLYRKQNLGIVTIADLLGVSQGAVHKFAVENGIALRPTGTRTSQARERSIDSLGCF